MGAPSSRPPLAGEGPAGAGRGSGEPPPPQRGDAYIGCSGWSYQDWRGVIYPPRLPAREWFTYYSSLFNTVEVNNTFYRLPAERTFAAWAAQAPPGFTYALKVNRFGTHQLKLARPERWLPAYMERASLLGPALGPNLLQLPPHWKRATERLASFLDVAAETATSLAKRAPRASWLWAVEVRDPSWLDAATYQVLAEHGAALCWHDMIAGHPWVLTAPPRQGGHRGWAYARFHGPRAPAEKYAGDYGEARLGAAAEKLLAWLDAGCDVYAYFNNDQGGAAVRDAAILARLLGSAARPLYPLGDK